MAEATPESLTAESGVIRSTASATLAGVLVYTATLVQYVVYGRRLGVGANTDALAVALAWAVAITGLVGTTFAKVIVPRYVAMRAASDVDASSVFRTSVTLVMAVGFAMMALTMLAAPLLSQILLPGADQATLALAGSLLWRTAPLQILWLAVWVLASLANAEHRFVLAAAAPVAAVVPVLAALLLTSTPSVEAVAGAYVVGAGAQLGVLALALWRRLGLLVPGMSAVFARGVLRSLVTVGAAFMLFNLAGLLVRAGASTGEPGDVAITDYALRSVSVVEQLLIGGALAVLTTRWSASKGSNVGELLRPIQFAIGAIAIVCGGMAVVAGEGVEILFASKQFDPEAVAATAAFIRWASPGVAAHMLLMLGISGLFARQADRAVLGVALITLTVTGLAVAGAATLDDIRALAVAYALGWAGGCAVTYWLLFPQRITRTAIGREVARSTIAVGPTAILSIAIGASLPGGAIVRGVVAGATFLLLASVVAAALDLAIIREPRIWIGRRWRPA